MLLYRSLSASLYNLCPTPREVRYYLGSAINLLSAVKLSKISGCAI